ncbi:MAG: SirB1 family protein [Acidimicrobiales bacterium]
MAEPSRSSDAAAAAERFSALVRGPEEAIPLDEAALLIAAQVHPGLDLPAELSRLDDIAASAAEPTFDGWRRLLFGELGFRGNTIDYHDPANSMLDEVLSRRTGIPITLAVVGMEVGRRMGVALAGVGMPGHFLLLHDDPGSGAVYVDAFEGGRLLDAEGCRERFGAVMGPEVPFLPAYLAPVGPRAILARMLANLRTVYRSRHEPAELAWVLRLRLAIPGVPEGDRAELARSLTATGRFPEAAAELERLAEDRPGQADELRSQALALRSRLN